MFRENLCKNLRSARLRKRLTQQVAADFLDIQQSALSKYENGVLEPDIETLCRMAIFYGISTDKLLGIDDMTRQL